MGDKIRRNALCPCGSGKKYKHCCLLEPRQGASSSQRVVNSKLPLLLKNGILIKEPKRGILHSIGSPGVATKGLRQRYGDYRIVEANPSDYVSIIDVDLPFYLPLEDEKFSLNLGEQSIIFFHKTKSRGEETFSTIDTDRLPFFSHLQIQSSAFIDNIENDDLLLSGHSLEGCYKSYTLIVTVLHRLNEFLVSSVGEDFLKELPQLSYKVTYAKKGSSPPEFVAQSVYPLSGIVTAASPQYKKSLDMDQLKLFLSQSVRIKSYAENSIAPVLVNRPFSQKILQTIHDFCFYTRQHSKALGRLQEEQIRDLYLVILKVLFTSAEGEAFHYDGKLDFKVTNPENKYEIVIGEFKWWDGDNTFAEAFQQAVRKHATGQESEIYIVMLNKRKDVSSVMSKIESITKKQPEYQIGTFQKVLLPGGSREIIWNSGVQIRSNLIPLRIAIADLFYENV